MARNWETQSVLNWISNDDYFYDKTMEIAAEDNVTRLKAFVEDEAIVDAVYDNPGLALKFIEECMKSVDWTSLLEYFQEDNPYMDDED